MRLRSTLSFLVRIYIQCIDNYFRRTFNLLSVRTVVIWAPGGLKSPPRRSPDPCLGFLLRNGLNDPAAHRHSSEFCLPTLSRFTRRKKTHICFLCRNSNSLYFRQLRRRCHQLTHSLVVGRWNKRLLYILWMGRRTKSGAPGGPNKVVVAL